MAKLIFFFLSIITLIISEIILIRSLVLKKHFLLSVENGLRCLWILGKCFTVT